MYNNKQKNNLNYSLHRIYILKPEKKSWVPRYPGCLTMLVNLVVYTRDKQSTHFKTNYCKFELV